MLRKLRVEYATATDFVASTPYEGHDNVAPFVARHQADEDAVWDRILAVVNAGVRPAGLPGQARVPVRYVHHYWTTEYHDNPRQPMASDAVYGKLTLWLNVIVDDAA